jgi:hypothetical protein
VEVGLAIQPPELQQIFSSETGTHETRIATNNEMRWMSMTWINLRGMTMDLTKMKYSGVPMMNRVTETMMRKKTMGKVMETKARRNSLDFLSSEADEHLDHQDPFGVAKIHTIL